MNKVLDRLYQGRTDDLLDNLKEGELNVVLTLCPKEEFPSPIDDCGFRFRRLPLKDGLMNDQYTWKLGIGIIENNIRAGAKIGIGCGAGVSRSPALCVAYLMHIGMHPYDAREYVIEKTNGLIHPVLWDQIKSLAQCEYGYRLNDGSAFRDI